MFSDSLKSSAVTIVRGFIELINCPIVLPKLYSRLLALCRGPHQSRVDFQDNQPSFIKLTRYPAGTDSETECGSAAQDCSTLPVVFLPVVEGSLH